MLLGVVCWRPCSEFKEMAVKGGDKLDLGGGHLMEFVMAPNLHWYE